MPELPEPNCPAYPYFEMMQWEDRARRFDSLAEEYSREDPPDDALTEGYRREAAERRYRAYYLAVKHDFDPDAERLERVLRPHLATNNRQ